VTYGIIIRVLLDNLYNFRNAAVSPYPNAAAALPTNTLKLVSCPYYHSFNATNTSNGIFVLNMVVVLG
jgi:hypothetical protein